MALSYLAGKSLTTKDTKYSKGKVRLIFQAFSFVTFVYFVVKKIFPVKTVRPGFFGQSFTEKINVFGPRMITSSKDSVHPL